MTSVLQRLPWLRSAALALLLPAAALVQAADGSVAARILALESLGRAQPEAAAAQLQQLLPAAGGGVDRLELLTVQGIALANVAMADGAERSAAQLAAWAATGEPALTLRAAAAAQLVRAVSSTRSGSGLDRGDAMLRDAIASLPLALPPRERYRYILAHAYVHDRAGRPQEAVRLGHEALALADHEALPWRQSEARTSLAYSYYGARQIERAGVLTREAIGYAEQAQDAVALARAHNIDGMVLDAVGDSAGERRAFEAGIAAARSAGSTFDEVRLQANLADFYLMSGDYRTALVHAEQALPLARALKDANSETVALANIGLAQISLGHGELGKRLVAESIAIDERRGATASVSGTWAELGRYLERAGDLAGAVAAYHRHRRMATTILREDQQKAIFTIQEQYDAEQRARALDLLERERRVKSEQLRRRDLQQQLWWLLAGVFVVGLAAVALLVRRVRRNNRLLSTSNEVLQLQSERDPLTGLANRRHFQAVMRRRSARGTLDGSAYLIDIDHFKQVNDRHGHGAGDAVLVEVAQRLRATLRDDDLIVRWGGEEFLVVVQAGPAAAVDALAERMLKVLDEAPVAVDGRAVAVTASIGYATFPIGPGARPVAWERAIGLVDTAMYLAKAHGRNRAYGLRLLRDADDAALDALIRDLDAACAEGRVALTLLGGNAPPPLAPLAPPAHLQVVT